MAVFDKNEKTNSSPSLDMRTADQMLQNVFDVCGVESNTIPLEVLSSYSNYRRERFALQKILLILMMVLFALLPILFIPPSYSVDLAAKSSVDQEYGISVDSFLPVSYVTASLNGQNVPVYHTGEKDYAVIPDQNGLLEIKVALINRQYITREVAITGIDTEHPAVTTHAVAEGKVFLYVTDEDSGVDYEGIYALTLTGEELRPDYDEVHGYFSFDYPEDSLYIYVPDHAGNQLHLILSPTASDK